MPPILRNSLLILSVIVVPSCQRPPSPMQPAAATKSNRPVEKRSKLDFRDFTDPAGIQLVGDATTTKGRLRLTSTARGQTGAAWFTEKQFVSVDFQSSFQFQLGGNVSSDGVGGSDGFAFVILNTSATAMTSSSGCLGYNGNAQ